jgi:cytosine/adenosine deaminase-related metal-dependent hydrolase
VTPDVDAPEQSAPLHGLVIPGLANAHSHAFQRALRGRAEAAESGGSFWTWREQMYSLAWRINPDTMYVLARATYGEMVLAGVVAVGEFHYLHHRPDGTPYEDPNRMGEALITAAGDAGLRLTLLDTCYLRGGLDGRPLDGAQRRFGDASAAAWEKRSADGVSVGDERQIYECSVFQIDVPQEAAVCVGVFDVLCQSYWLSLDE